MFQTVIHTQGLSLSGNTESVIRRQIEQRLHRFSDHVRFVSIHIKDINGPRGGTDRSVVIRVRLRGRTELAASACRSRVLAATDAASRKTKRQVKRAIQRQKNFERLNLGRAHLICRADKI